MHQIEARAFGLQDLGGHAIHAHLGHRHFARDLERHDGERCRPHSHLDARDRAQGQVRRQGGIDPVIGQLRIAHQRRGVLASGTRGKTGPGVEEQAVVPGGELPGHDLLDVIGVVNQVEGAQIGAAEHTCEQMVGARRSRQQIERQPDLIAGAQVAQHRTPLFVQ